MIDPKCDMTAYGQWSECSSLCGPGVMAKFRTFLNEEVSLKHCVIHEGYLQQTMPCNETKPCADERDYVVSTKYVPTI